ILGAHILRDVFAVVPSVLGGRASAYENGLARAKETALAEMVAYGATLGADAIVGIDLDCATLGEGVSMPMVYASRTAVVIGSGPAP
ncbi:MAG: heavy metal-binding domain-containing protein, partial [Casimicrobiaceae bacterium]